MISLTESEKYTLSSEVQSRKHSSGITSVPSPIVRVLRDVQLKKDLSSSSQPGRSSSVRAVPSNALVLIFFRPEGKLQTLSLEQPLNALLPISVIVSGSVISSRAVQPLNRFEPTAVIVCVLSVFLMMTFLIFFA